MARTLRTKSETGFYHVMMRGVNHQIIFEQPSVGAMGSGTIVPMIITN